MLKKPHYLAPGPSPLGEGLTSSVFLPLSVYGEGVGGEGFKFLNTP
jgi:hypothetical protein